MSTQPRAASQRLMLNSILNLFTQVAVAIINFLLIDFFLFELGAELYGVWIIVGSIFSYRAQLTLGLNSAVNRHVPVALAREDDEGIRRILSTAAAFFAGLGVILLLATGVLYWNLGSWFAISPEHLPAAQQQALIIGVSFSFAITLHFYSATLSGLQRYDLINGFLLTITLIRTAGVVWLLTSGHGIVAMAIIYGGAELCLRGLSTAAALRLLPGRMPAPRFVDAGLLRQFLTYGTSTALYTAGAVLIYKACDLVIGALMSPAIVPRFYVAVTPLILLSTLVNAFTAAVKPAVSDLDARDEGAAVREIALLGQKYTLFLILPSVAFLAVAGESFLRIWVGDNFSDPSVIPELSTVLCILAVGHGLRLTQHSNFIVLVGRGIHRIYGVTVGATAVVAVAMAVASLKVFDAGLLGIAWSCAVPLGFMSVVVLASYFNRRMEIRSRESLRRVWLPALLGTAPSIAAIVAWNAFAPPNSWIELGALVGSVGALTAACCWVFGLDAKERTRFASFLGR